MNFHQISALAACLFNVGLTVFVLRRDLRSNINKVYLGWAAAVTLWNVGALCLYSLGPEERNLAFFWAHVLQAGVIFMPVTLFHLCTLVAQLRADKVVTPLYVVHALFLLALLSGFFIHDVKHIGVGWWSVPAPGFWAFMVVYIVTTTSLVAVLYLKQKTLAPLYRTRVRALLIAIFALWVFGTNDLLPILMPTIAETHLYPFTKIPFIALGNLAAIFYALIVGYSVLQHQLLDIHLQLSRAAALLVRVCAVGVACAALLYGASQLVEMSTEAIFTAIGVMVTTFCITSFLFPRVMGRGDELLERWIIGDRFVHHDALRRFIEQVRHSPDPQALVPELRRIALDVMRVKSFQLILLDETTRNYTLFFAHPERLLGPVADLHADSPVFRYFQTSHPGYLACKISYAMPGESELERAARLQLRIFDPEFCFPLFSGREPFGMLLLGGRGNGELYTPQDLKLLTELAQSLSLLLNQVRLKNQVLMSQEQELLGRMSRGLAHDLNNLLTPVQTFLQLTAQGLVDEESRNELLPIASRNIETVRSYVNEALFFSRTHALEVKALRLDETIRAAVELMQPRAQEKNVEINIQGLSALLVEMDQIMIQRMLGNLISNAIDASPPGGPLKIQIVKLPRTETTRDWIRVKIIDAGEGISSENLQRIFTPYFTTKNRGDGKRGFGLGLAISRKIVHLHGGNLTITSLEQKGTTVQIDLPNRHTLNPSRNPKLTDATYEATYRK